MDLVCDLAASLPYPPARASAQDLLQPLDDNTLSLLSELLAARNAAVGEVRGLGPMLALELTEATPDLAKAVTSAAHDRGLVLLSCGIYGNVIRILVPLTIDDALLERGLDLLEESLGDARAG